MYFTCSLDKRPSESEIVIQTLKPHTHKKKEKNHSQVGLMLVLMLQKWFKEPCLSSSTGYLQDKAMKHFFCFVQGWTSKVEKKWIDAISQIYVLALNDTYAKTAVPHILRSLKALLVHAHRNELSAFVWYNVNIKQTGGGGCGNMRRFANHILMYFSGPLLSTNTFNFKNVLNSLQIHQKIGFLLQSAGSVSTFECKVTERKFSIWDTAQDNNLDDGGKFKQSSSAYSTLLRKGKKSRQMFQL